MLLLLQYIIQVPNLLTFREPERTFQISLERAVQEAVEFGIDLRQFVI